MTAKWWFKDTENQGHEPQTKLLHIRVEKRRPGRLKGLCMLLLLFTLLYLFSPNPVHATPVPLLKATLSLLETPRLSQSQTFAHITALSWISSGPVLRRSLHVLGFCLPRRSRVWGKHMALGTKPIQSDVVGDRCPRVSLFTCNEPGVA